MLDRLLGRVSHCTVSLSAQIGGRYAALHKAQLIWNRQLILGFHMCGMTIGFAETSLAMPKDIAFPL